MSFGRWSPVVSPSLWTLFPQQVAKPGISAHQVREFLGRAKSQPLGWL